MVTATSSGTRAKLIHRSAVERAKGALGELPKKEKEHVSLQEAISQISDSIRDALAKGHSYADIAGFLSDKFETKVSVWSLRRYIPADAKPARGKRAVAAPEGKAKRGRRSKAEIAAALNGQNGSAPQATALLNIPVLETSTPANNATTASKASESAPPTQVRRRGRAAGTSAKATNSARTSSKTKTTSRGKSGAKADAAPSSRGRKKSASDNA